jgi:hypothetical protein
MITYTSSVEENTTEQSRYNFWLQRTLDYSYRFAFPPDKAEINWWGDQVRDAVREQLKTFIKEKLYQCLKCPTAQ